MSGARTAAGIVDGGLNAATSMAKQRLSGKKGSGGGGSGGGGGGKKVGLLVNSLHTIQVGLVCSDLELCSGKTVGLLVNS